MDTELLTSHNCRITQESDNMYKIVLPNGVEMKLTAEQLNGMNIKQIVESSNTGSGDLLLG